MLFDLAVKHPRCRFTVNVPMLSEHVEHPLLPRKPCEDSCFDGSVVGNNETAAGAWYKRGTNKLREHIRGAVIEHIQKVEITVFDKGANLLQLREMVLGQIL